MSSSIFFLLISIFFYIDICNSQNSSNTSTTVDSIKHPYQPLDHIVNPHNFSFILNPGYSVCNNSMPAVYILVYVHSGPANYQRRIVIRETWSTQTLFPDLRIVFMIGKTLDKTLMKAIEYENEIYQDIVQEDFIDSYKNLTYKGIMALKWISIYCSKIKYILKVDDDIVVNTFTLINHLKFLDKNNLNKHSTILCLLWQAMGVMRDRLDRYRKRKELFFFCSKSKWYLSKEDFPLDKFPPYCSGSGKIFNYN
jgi:beta-1,3-galactosyltransferase 1